MGFCTKCGAELKDGTLFCERCGNQVSSSSNEGVFDNNSNIEYGKVLDKRKGPAIPILAFVLSISAVFIGVIVKNPVVGIVLLDVAITLAIISLCAKNRLYGLSIAGIIVVLIWFTMYALTGYPLLGNHSTTNSKSSYSSTTSNNKGSISSTTSNGVNPDLKAFLDSYEDFVDDYVVFMEKYYDNPTDLSLLTDYTEFLQDYSDFTNKLNQYDTRDMSTDDYNYYIEVTSRCSQKMLSVLGTE
ncbi:MAG: zinc-ribbon domain-containing protein [Pseudobutyrivibrio sp.]|nr:zinc-ribbon domain-containing protein [Pseudobutyrivibrio sp.]